MVVLKFLACMTAAIVIAFLAARSAWRKRTPLPWERGVHVALLVWLRRRATELVVLAVLMAIVFAYQIQQFRTTH